jgi:hypothetical protein
MIGNPCIKFGWASSADAVPAIATNSASTSRLAAADFNPFLLQTIFSLYKFAPPLLRELTHNPVSICPHLLISMFDANAPLYTTADFKRKNK